MKTYGIVQISKKYISAIFEVPFSPSHLPLISEPKRWQKDSSNPKRNFGLGGFHFNEKYDTEGLTGNVGNKGIAQLTDQEIESINYLQCNVYHVNEEYLEVFKTYGPAFFFQYAKGTNGFDNFILAQDGIENGLIVIKSLEQFIEADEVYVRVKADLPEKKGKNKTAFRRLMRRKIELQDQYFNLVNMLIEFINIFYIAVLYQEFDIFFVLSMDGRGRFYYSSAKGGFGLQTNKTAKSLIELVGNTYKNPNLSFKKVLTPNSDKRNSYTDTQQQLLSKFADEPDFHLAVKHYLGIKSSYVGIDASCSGTSIISGLIGYKKGLEYSNVVLKNSEMESEKKCIYLYFLNHLYHSIEKLEDIFPRIYIAGQAKSQKISSKKIKEVLQFVFEKIPVSLLTRDHTKNFVMCQNYAQQNQGRSNYIHDYFVYPELAFETQGISDKVDYKFRRSISFKLAQWIERHYKICFPELDKFCNLVRNKLSHTHPLLLCAESSGTFEVKIIEGEIIRTTKPSFNVKSSRKRYELSYFVSTNKISKTNSSRAAVANFIHFLDSRLCSRVIYKCLQNDIILWTNHDCFYTAEENINQVKKFYFESYRELLLDGDTLSLFFTANHVIQPLIIQNYIEKVKVKRQQVNEKIKKGEWVMSENILS